MRNYLKYVLYLRCVCLLVNECVTLLQSNMENNVLKYLWFYYALLERNLKSSGGKKNLELSKSCKVTQIDRKLWNLNTSNSLKSRMSEIDQMHTNPQRPNCGQDVQADASCPCPNLY